MKNRICIAVGTFIISLSFLSSVTPGSAATSEIGKHIEAGHFEGLDAYYEDLHQRSLSGNASPGEVRNAFAIFERPDTELKGFVESWAKEYPQSPYAHVALGWNLQSHAMRMRGTDYYKYTWSPAMEAFYESFERAQIHAGKAYELAPSLLPASDLLLTLSPATDVLNKNEVFEIVENALQHIPNKGTLRRTARVFDPKWGGDIGTLEELCTQFGTLADEELYDSTEICVADLILQTAPEKTLRDRAIAIAKANDWNGFERHRYSLYQYFWTRSSAELTREDLVEYLDGDGRFDFETVMAFYDDIIGDIMNPANPLLRKRSTRFLEDAQKEARRRLRDGPANFGLLKVLYFEMHPAQQFETFHSALRDWSELLKAAPFSPQFWDAAANGAGASTAFNATIPNFLTYTKAIHPLWTNAIAYSNHRPYYVRRTYNRLTGLHWAAASLLHKEGAFHRHQLSLEIDREIGCQVIRVSRILDAVCSGASQDTNCKINSPQTDETVSKVFKSAEDNNLCRHERMSEIADIVYHPVDVTVGTYQHSAQRVP